MPRKHIVRPGECIESIALQHGLSWQALWNAPGNRALRGQRPDPNVLAPGDVVDVPDRHAGGGLELRRGVANQYRGRPRSTRLHLHLQAADAAHPGSPPRDLADRPFELRFGVRIIRGRTNSAGIVDVLTPLVTGEACLVVDPGTPGEIVFALAMGDLDPVATPRGREQRLRNLAGTIGSACDDAALVARHGR